MLAEAHAAFREAHGADRSRVRWTYTKPSNIVTVRNRSTAVPAAIWYAGNMPALRDSSLYAAMLNGFAGIVQETLVTFAACGPFSPVTTSNSTLSPSCRLLNPFIWIAEKWTNTSGPPSRPMKP